MPESRDHRLLVVALVNRMGEQGITVLGAEAPGWRRPALVGGRRPDVLGYYRPGGCVVAGEAKRGPELWDCARQLAEIAEALPSQGPPGAGALLIIGVMPGWADEARELCTLIACPRTNTSVWSPARSL